MNRCHLLAFDPFDFDNASLDSSNCTGSADVDSLIIFYDSNWMALFLIAFMIWGVVGNVLVCMSILTDRRLQNVTNYFLFSLAVADLMVCVLVMPLSIINELYHGHWPFDFDVCLLWVSLDVYLCSVSIMHMSVISFDRFLGISRPFLTRKRSKHMLFLKIFGVWAATIVISSCPLLVLAFIDSSNVFQSPFCQIFNSYFQIYGSVLTFFIPFIIMAFTFFRTTQLLRKQAALVCKAEQQQDGLGLRRTRTRKTTETMLQTRKRLPATPTPSTATSTSTDQPFMTALMRMHVANESELNMTPAEIALAAQAASANSTVLTSLKRVLLKKNSSAMAVVSEQKASKVLGVVFCSFFICWAPFFTTNVTMAICGGYCLDKFPSILGSIFLWLGYLSSIVNPLIYTTFNQYFRQAFKRLLRCQCRNDDALRCKTSTTTNSGGGGTILTRKESTLHGEFTLNTSALLAFTYENQSTFSEVEFA